MSKAIKESFSGPALIINAARSAAEKTHGEQNGAWSRWVCDAIREKLHRDGHDDNTDPRAKLIAFAEEVGMTRAISAVKREARTRRKSA